MSTIASLQLPKKPGQANVQTKMVLKPSIQKQRVQYHQKFVLNGCLWEVVDMKQSGELLVCKLIGALGKIEPKKKSSLLITP